MVPIIKHELKSIVFNKRYMAGFLLQLLLLVLLVPIFSSYLSESNPSMLTPNVKEFIPIGVIDLSKNSQILMGELLKEERFEITFFDRYPAKELENGEIAALVAILKDYDESELKELPVWFVVTSSNPKRESVSDVLVNVIQRASDKIGEERKAKLGIETTEPISIERQLLKPQIIETGGMRFSSFFMGYLIPIVLFFPIFMSGGLIIDSLVGEKEKKTIELLLSAPVSRGRIIVGKLLSIFGWISLQCLLWLFIIEIQGIPIANLWGVFLLLTAINLAVISTAFVLATYSEATKEASISIMLFYVFIFTALIISLSLEFFNPRASFSFIPFNAISALAMGSTVSPFILVLLISILGTYSLATIFINTKLVERDDIIFGPLPALQELIDSGIYGILRKFEKWPIIGFSLVSFISGGIALPFSMAFELALAMAMLFFFGYTYGTIVVLIWILALIEEVLKPMTLYSLKIEKPSVRALCGAVSGATFFIFENIFVAIVSFFSMPWMLYRIVTLRTGTTLLIHVLSSSIAVSGIGYSKEKFLLRLLIATVIHASYNIVLFWVVM